MSGGGPYLYPKWVPSVLGGVIVLAFGYFYFQQVVSSSLSLFNVGSTYWASFQWSRSTPLFGYLVLLLGRLRGSTSSGFDLAAEVVCIAFVFSAYFATSRLTGRWYVGVVAAALAGVSPAFISASADSSYSVILAFAALFPAIYLGSLAVRMTSELLVILTALFSLAVSLAEPALGAVLAISLAFMAARAASRRNFRFAFIPAITGVVAVLALLEVNPGPALPWVGLSSTFLLLAAPAAILAVYFNWSMHSDSMLPLGSFSLVAGAASLLFGAQYVIFALVLTASTLLLSLGRLTTNQTEEGKTFVRVDVKKSVALILIGLLAVTDFGISAAAYRATANSDAAIVSRYGDPQLLQAMSWLSQGTPAGSTVLSEYPLSLWVESLGGRPSLSNYGLNSTFQGFINDYNADTMLNSTYELRNGYVRARDWAPVAPQRSPSIAVASGDQYLEALYIDENHLNLLDQNGAPITTPYANFTKVSSGFVVVNQTLSLQQRYIIDGVNVERDVFMGPGAKVTVEYVIHSNQTGLITGASVQLWVSKARAVGYTSLTGNTLQLDLDAGNLVITATGPLQTITYGPDRVYGQPNLYAKYTSKADTFSFEISISGLNTKKVSWSRGLESVTSLDLFRQYRVSYVAIPTLVKARQLDLFGLYYPTFVSVYQNSKLTIYQVFVGGQ